MLQLNPDGELDGISSDEKRRSADVRVSSRTVTTTDGTPDEVYLFDGWIKETLKECRESYSGITTNPSNENAWANAILLLDTLNDLKLVIRRHYERALRQKTGRRLASMAYTELLCTDSVDRSAVRSTVVEKFDHGRTSHVEYTSLDGESRVVSGQALVTKDGIARAYTVLCNCWCTIMNRSAVKGLN